jgi:TonB family protein
MPSKIQLLLLIITAIIFGPCSLSAQTAPPPKPKVDELFRIIRHIPAFPGCEDQRRGPKRRQCEQDKLARFISDNLVYPEAAKRKRLEGTAVVRFYAEKDGTISPLGITENPGLGLGEEAMRLLHLMNRKGLRWTRPFRALFQLSIEFSLDKAHRGFVPSVLVLITEAVTWSYPANDTLLVTNNTFQSNMGPNGVPCFPGCETTWSPQERLRYTSDHLRTFFKANFHHQNASVYLGGEGDLVVRFIVERDGSISAVNVDQDPGGGVAAAAVRTIKRMIKEDMRWLPGKKGAVEVSIPISLIPKGMEIQLPRNTQAAVLAKKKTVGRSSSIPPRPRPKTEKPWLATNLKEPPLFPGCEGLGSFSEKQQCAAAKLEAFIQGNLRYPAKAVEYGTSGTALVSFIVEKDGGVSNARILHDPGAGTGKEALRMINLMNTKGLKYSPQKSGGRSVKVLYTLPVKFELNRD